MGKKIRVLRILNRLNLGGPTYNAVYLTKYISKKFTTRLVAGVETKSETSSKFILKNNSVNFIQISNMSRKISFFNDLISFFKLISIINKFKPHIIHTHAAKSGFLGRIAGIIMQTPIIIHTFHGHVFHSYFNQVVTKLFILIEKILAFKSNKIIVLSNLQKNELVYKYNICNEDKIKIVNLGINIDTFSKKKNQKKQLFLKKYNLKNTILIGIIGRLTKIKNHKLFIDIAYELLNSNKKNIKFFIIGDGEEKNNLVYYCKKLNLITNLNKKTKTQNVNIFFTSWIKRIDQVYPALDIVINTSYNEGTPLSIIEAMASKKTVVATNVGGVGDLITDGYNGFLFNLKEKKKIVKKINYLIKNKKLRKTIGENSFNSIKKKYSYKLLVNNIENLYNAEIIKKNI